MKVAIAGAGYIAAIHAKAVLANGGQVVAVVEKFPAKGGPFSAHLGARHYTTMAEMLKKREAVDALIIGTPNFLHASQAVAALKAGLHVLVEKPMAMNAVEAEKMLSASQKSGPTLMVAHCWRFDEDVLWLKKQSSRLGTILRTKGYGVHVQWGPAGWFTRRSTAGGGALADMGIHALDTARFLLGDPQPLSVYARIGTYYKDFDVDDTGLLIVNWDSGVVSYIESGWWQPHADGPEAATQLYGTKGFGQLFPTRLELGRKVVDPGFRFPRQEHCPQSMYDAQMAYFFRCVRTGRTPVPGGAEGVMNMKIVEAAYQSARTGKVVSIRP